MKTLFIIILLLSTAAHANGTISATVKADSDVQLSEIENLPRFMQSCLTNPDSSHLCEQVVDVEKLISECAKDPNSNGLCENIVGG